MARAASFSDDTLAILKDRLDDKLKKHYGRNTALVIRQLSPIWDREDWLRYLPNLPWSELDYRADTYDRGIWVLTLKDETGIGRDEILQIDPGVNTAGP